jgi:S-phase kinase-associated protein 1
MSVQLLGQCPTMSSHATWVDANTDKSRNPSHKTTILSRAKISSVNVNQLVTLFIVISANMSMVKLQTSDGDEFEVEKTVACMSNLIKTMLEDLDDGEVIPLPMVKSDMAKLAFTWAEHHKNDLPAADEQPHHVDPQHTHDISPWDQEFLNLEQSVVFDLTVAAHYLSMKGLVDVTCKTIANMVKGKTPEELRKTFYIKNDFSEKEEEQIRKENGSLEDK